MLEPLGCQTASPPPSSEGKLNKFNSLANFVIRLRLLQAGVSVPLVEISWPMRFRRFVEAFASSHRLSNKLRDAHQFKVRYFARRGDMRSSAKVNETIPFGKTYCLAAIHF